jgi:hypothetical protein
MTSYRQLLTEVLEIGRDDGRLAAAFESSAAGLSDRCLGRTPAEFARLLWGDRPGLPAGLEVNAPLWYAAGYAEGLAEAASACGAVLAVDSPSRRDQQLRTATTVPVPGRPRRGA